MDDLQWYRYNVAAVWYRLLAGMGIFPGCLLLRRRWYHTGVMMRVTSMSSKLGRSHTARTHA